MNPTIIAIFNTLLEAGVSEKTFAKIFTAMAIVAPTFDTAPYTTWYRDHSGGLGEFFGEGGK